MDAYCPVRLTRRRTASASRTTSWPSTYAVPSSGSISVASIRIVVVLPAPFGPRNPYTVPVGTARSTPQTARVSPNDFARPDASIARGERESKAVLLVELGGRPFSGIRPPPHKEVI